jgi:hypothetical protein
MINRAVRHIFDCEDGLLEGIEMESEMGRIATVKEELLRHFKISTKLALLDIIYNPNFSKSFVASFCKRLSECMLICKNLIKFPFQYSSRGW